MIRGSARFDGLALGEGTFSFLATSPQLKTKTAFISSASGKTHGWTEATGGWSKETMLALEALRECIEKDLAGVHFTSFEDSTGPTPERTAGAIPPGGLGEHLQSEERQI